MELPIIWYQNGEQTESIESYELGHAAPEDSIYELFDISKKYEFLSNKVNESSLIFFKNGRKNDVPEQIYLIYEKK